MTTKSMPLPEEFFAECPQCLVYSVKLSAEEFSAVSEGQQMIAQCPVCDALIYVSN